MEPLLCAGYLSHLFWEMSKRLWVPHSAQCLEHNKHSILALFLSTFTTLFRGYPHFVNEENEAQRGLVTTT